jgi:hypothetical protein
MIELSPEGRMHFKLYSQIVGNGFEPQAAFDLATEALTVFNVRTGAPTDQAGDIGERAAQLEEQAWNHFQKVKATAERLAPALATAGARQIADAVAQAERRWLEFGTFRLREALGQWSKTDV